MPEIKTGSFYFGDDKNAAKRFAKHCKVNRVRYAYRNTDIGTVIDVLADDTCMFCLTEGYKIITKHYSPETN